MLPRRTDACPGPSPSGRAATPRRQRHERGAAAVEFALVLPILLLVMFGILQYGLYFNDSLNTRQGVREAARMGVVQTPIVGCGTVQMEQLACETKNQIDALTGVEYVKVRAAAWTKGTPLVVCAYVKSDGAVGLLPMPNGGWIFSRTQMAIEKDTPVPSSLSATSSPALPAGAPAWPTGC